MIKVKYGERTAVIWHRGSGKPHRLDINVAEVAEMTDGLRQPLRDCVAVCVAHECGHLAVSRAGYSIFSQEFPYRSIGMLLHELYAWWYAAGCNRLPAFSTVLRQSMGAYVAGDVSWLSRRFLLRDWPTVKAEFLRRIGE